MNIKLLSIDMDGTCLNSKHRISDKTLNSLYKAKEAGIEIVPTTGRALSCLPLGLRNRDLYRYVISSNGAAINDIKENRVIYSKPIDSTIAREVIRRCQGKNVGTSIHINNEYILQGKPLRTLGRIVYGKDAAESFSVRSINSYIDNKGGNIEELQFYYFSDKARIKVSKILSEYENLLKAYDDNYVEVYDINASKGNALKYLYEKLGYQKEEAACIGDGENDISNFKVAGTSFMMGNGDECLKDYTTYRVADNDHDGVSEAIDFLLNT
ncbi:MAG: Cof-type HAD-IIB family hydrolase [Erysipelotrichaceae bacterium]